MKAPSSMSWRIFSPWFVVLIFVEDFALELAFTAWQDAAILMLYFVGVVLAVASTHTHKSAGDRFLDECVEVTLRQHCKIPHNR